MLANKFDSYNIVEKAIFKSRVYPNGIPETLTDNIDCICSALDKMAMTADCMGKDIEAFVNNENRTLTIRLRSLTITLRYGDKCSDMFHKLVDASDSFRFDNFKKEILTTSFEFSLDRLEKEHIE